MYQYTEAELTNKIHAFLLRKTQKFPELEKIGTHLSRNTQEGSHRPSVIEKLHDLRLQRAHL